MPTYPRQFLTLLFSIGLSALSFAASPEDAFRNPPDTAKPGVWWHWMGSNVSKEGITRDLEEFKKAGISGATIFGMGDVCTPWAGHIENSPTDGLLDPVRVMAADWKQEQSTMAGMLITESLSNATAEDAFEADLPPAERLLPIAALAESGAMEALGGGTDASAIRKTAPRATDPTARPLPTMARPSVPMAKATAC